MITTVSLKKREKKKSVIRKRHVLFSLRIRVGKNKGSSPKRAEGTAMFTAAKLKCCVMSWSPRPNYASSSWSQERFSNSHSQPGKLYQHLSVTSFLHWGANGTIFLWNKVSFSHYSNESKEPESASLRSVPCSQRVTFLPVLVNAGALVARQIGHYQPEAEESSVQKENRKSLAQAVWFFPQWPTNVSQLPSLHLGMTFRPFSFAAMSHLSPALTSQDCVSSGYSSTSSIPFFSDPKVEHIPQTHIIHTLSWKALFSQLAVHWHTQSIPSWLTIILMVKVELLHRQCWHCLAEIQ